MKDSPNLDPTFLTLYGELPKNLEAGLLGALEAGDTREYMYLVVGAKAAFKAAKTEETRQVPELN
jgi:hypothetical protein